MSKQDISNSLSDLETALNIISNNLAMPASGSIYPFYESARDDLKRARKALDNLHEHPFKEEIEPSEYVEVTSCYCNATNFPPCGFCIKEIES